MPDQGVQHSGRDYFNDLGVHALPRGHVRLGYDADDRGLLGHVYCGIILPARFRVRQRRDRRGRMQHLAQDVQRRVLVRRRRNERHGGGKRRHVHSGLLLPRGRDDRHGQRPMQHGVLLPHGLGGHHGQRPVQRGVLLHRGLRVRQRRHRRWSVRHGAKGLHLRCWVLLSRRLDGECGQRLPRGQLLRGGRRGIGVVLRGLLLSRELRVRQRCH